MISLLLLCLLLAVYKVMVLMGFGYLTFRRVERPDCYANNDSIKPNPNREDPADENVTQELMTLI
eukprot:CAMPEP_0168621716 /NCGR_PEP_ID=MMETSP0449_2-20121227/7856_1 /TAXON_ID=1082188 /ORGANISM="Strombidium rassoulzadegani, Strain ras09" /LENGTH=64 /DNA_ID=CAMNT_0008662881 /DNA_START=31 /DNA_END=225 /DNA_ORIENTATION=-